MSHGTTILMELFVIFIWAKALAEVFEHFHLPGVLGEITAGAILGPNAIALIHPSEFTLSIAKVGAVFLLLNVGLETNPQELIRVGAKSLRVALGGVLLPFVAGFGYMLLRGFSPHEATFVGAALVATSVAVTARVLADLRVLSSESARVILGAAVFDDILGMLVLALVAGLASAGSIRWLQLGILAVEAAGFAFAMIFVVPRLIRRVRVRIERFSTQHAPVFLAMGLGLGLSAAAERIGLAAIIGAFFTGLAFAEYGDEWGIRPRVEGVAEFLGPFFFFTIGTQLDLRVFSSGSLLITAIVLSIIAIASKLIGCGVPMLGSDWRTVLQVGVGMVPRAEVGLIVAALGLQMGLISKNSYAVVVFMAFVTTIVTPPVLRAQFKPAVPAAIKAAVYSRRSMLGRILRPVAGLVICSVLSVGASLLFRESSFRKWVPVLFLLFVVFIARILGRLAGVLGTCIAALIFAMFLFSPVGSWVVLDESARNTLGWMTLAGVAISHFLGSDRTETPGNLAQA
jgi:Kef-type K+ transport system membrane component KefB